MKLPALALLLVGVAGTAAAQIPTNVRAAATAPTTVEIAWDAAMGARGYGIERAASPSGPWTSLALIRGTSYTDTSAPAGSTIAYRVVSSGPRGGASEPVTVTTPPARLVFERPLTRIATLPAAFTPRTITTQAIAMTGRRFTPRTITTQAIAMTGRRFTSRTITTGAIAMTGRRFAPRTITTGAIAMTGRRFAPRTITTQAITMTGRGGEP